MNLYVISKFMYRKNIVNDLYIQNCE